MELRNTHLLPKSILLAALISFATLIPSASAIVADPVELVQIAPDVDSGSNWEIALERVVDPYTDRNGVVNFSFDLKNISGQDLELREMEFSYLASNGTTLLQQTAPPDQISDLLVRNDPASGAWSMSGKASLVGRPWDSFLSSWSDLESQGMRMIDIETYVDGGTRLYSGLFEPETYSPYALVGLPWNEFLSQWQNIESQGQRMIDIESYTDGRSRLYAGIFAPGTYSPYAVVGLPWDEFLSQWQNIESQGQRMIDIESYVDGGTRLYTGIFAPGTYSPYALVGHPWEEFLSQWQKIESQGQRMIDIESYVDGGTRLYTGIFAPGTYSPYALVGFEWAPFLSDWQSIEYQGQRMIDIETYTSGRSRLYAGIFAPGPPIKWASGERLLFFSPEASFSNATPALVHVTLLFDNYEPAWTLQVPIENYSNKTPDQSFAFPASQSDLGADQYWAMAAKSVHDGPKPWLGHEHPRRNSNHHRAATWGGATEGSYWFGQMYAYDLGVAEWNRNSWAFCEDGCDDNSDFFVWDVPLYAAENGVVLYCWSTRDDNPAPGQESPKPMGAPNGGNILWVQHSGGEVALYAHLRDDTIPSSVCPANGVQNPGVPVSKGDFIGNAGNSGSSSAPHLHLHIQDSWTLNPLDKGEGLPMLFNNIDVGGANSQNPSWISLNDQAPVSDDSTDSNLPNVLIRIDE